MPEIVIPENFEKKLPNSSFIYTLIKNTKDLLWETPYFPEYTMHNEGHISAVLKLAGELIPAETLNILDPRSIEILAGAIILHDLGMFIKRAGLKRLLFGEHRERRVENLDRPTWNEAWRDFYGKARRYTDRQLIHLFGNASPIEKLPSDDVAEGNYLLYGEFIRQNHARLAFDITQIGFPGNGMDIDVFANCSCDKPTRTMIGLVARSHGMNKLRDAEDFLGNYPLTPEDIPLYYLMAVLRMADILHIGQERAPITTEQKDRMNSPESQRQFHLNQAIINGPSFDREHKSVHIVADPDCTSTFEDVENLLRDIQQELDSCWAVLAEKYAYKYELSIHRLVSNLSYENKVAAFNKKFLTRRATLDVNPDIVKLLIEPLYQKKPSFGVRELIQNAVDACNERKLLEDNFAGEITVRVDTKNRTFEITDNGIGMNEDVLRNYYLVAGSSYRYSDVWREKYTDEDGKAKFARSGRLGIGALASFLLGNEITVTTRHKDDELGFQFSYTIEPKKLDVIRIEADVGTKIVIKLHKESFRFFTHEKNNHYFYDYNFTIEPLKWYCWYHFSAPEIRYYIDEKQVREDQYIIPDKGVNKDGWYDVPSNVYSSIKLNFSQKYLGDFLVNGITVTKIEVSSLPYVLFGDDFSHFISGISIVDSDNIIKMDLARTVIYDCPESDHIWEETFLYYLARLLTFPVSDAAKLVISQDFYDIKFAATNDGFTLFTNSFLSHTNQTKILILMGNPKILYKRELLINSPVVIFNGIPDSHIDIANEIVTLYSMSGNINISQNCYNYWCNLSVRNKKLLLLKKKLSDTRCNKGIPPSGLKLSKDLLLIMECTIADFQAYKDDEQELKLLREYLPTDVNGGWIPFDIEKRKEMYPRAFSELKRYL